MVTPFVGNQVKICEAFGFDIPDGCAPEHVARKTEEGMRGRPRKDKIVVKEEIISTKSPKAQIFRVRCYGKRKIHLWNEIKRKERSAYELL